jgi:hypothetical protein
VAHRIDLGASLESGALRLTFDGRDQEPRSVGQLDGRQQAVVLSINPRHPTKTDCPDPLHVGLSAREPVVRDDPVWSNVDPQTKRVDAEPQAYDAQNSYYNATKYPSV